MVKKTILIIIAIMAAVLLTFCYSMASEYFRDESREGKDVKIRIEKGESTRNLALDLQEKGAIRYVGPFLLKVYRTGNYGKLRYGSYTINTGMTLDQIIDILIKGGREDSRGSFMIPEGDTIERIAARLEKRGIMSGEEFRAAVRRQASSFAYADELPPEDQVFYRLEGYICPDTYYIDDDMTPDQFVKMILSQFEESFGKEREARAAKLGMSVEEVVIRASLIQKETEKAEEYPVVAKVIQNRLDAKMKLQFDSAIVYAVTKGYYGKERVLYSDLKVDSPYNTYINPGLPAGPVCSPSMEAIDGVLAPDENDYLFFQYDAVKDDGSNLYFKTYEEHDAAAKTATTEQMEETKPAATTEK